MNQIRRTDPMAEEISRIRDVVSHHDLPDFITGFDVELGEYHGEPAAWITFHLSGNPSAPVEELQARSEILVPLRQTLTAELFQLPTDPYPFFWYDYRETAPRS